MPSACGLGVAAGSRRMKPVCISAVGTALRAVRFYEVPTEHTEHTEI
jgi:hypothetical protein